MPAEPEPMKRDEVCAKLAEEGYKPEVLEKMPDDHLAECARMSGKYAENVPEPKPEDEEEKRFAEEEVGKLDPEKKKETADAYKEHVAKKFAGYAERGRKMFGEAFDIDTQKLVKPTNDKPDAEKHMEFSETQLETIVNKVTAKIEAGLKPIRQDVDKFKEDTKKDSLQAFVDSRLKAGKISPAELDRPKGRPNLFDQLMATDGSTIVHKFSEGGKTVEMSPLDLAKANIDARAPIKFGERIAPGKNGSGSNDDGEKAKVEQHFDSFAERFQAIGTKKEKLLQAFDIKKKSNPGLTAEQFLNV